jgi:hypothetical protein
MKRKLIIAGVILSIAIAAVVVFFSLKLANVKREYQLQAVELSTLRDSVFVLKNKNGELTYKLTSVEVDKKNLKEALEISGYNIQELKADNIKWKKLSNVLQMELLAVGTIETAIHDTFRIERIDTVYYSKVEDWDNKSLYIFNAKIENKKLFTDYRYDVDLKIFQEPTKSGTIITVKLSDPKAAIVSANSITIPEKKTIFDKWWVWTVAGFAGGVFVAK